MNYVIGIDGGGTKTKAALVGEDGKIYATVDCGTTNYQSIGLEEATDQITNVIKLLIERSSYSPHGLQSIACCLAGIDSFHDQYVMEEALHDKLTKEFPLNQAWQDRLQIRNDGFAALYSVDGSGVGAVVIAGTGSIAFAKDKTGQVYRAGGWGYMIGDLGSGFDIGKKALIAILGAAEELSPPTKLSIPILAEIGVEHESECIAWANAPERTPRDFAELVPIVVSTAESGDSVAKQILRNAGVELGILTNHVLRKGIWDEKHVSLVGGLANIWEWIAPALMETVHRENGPVHWVKPNYAPVIGAAIMAKQSISIK